MKKLLIAASLLATLPAISLAQDNVGCGAGSYLFQGQSGIAPQVLAVTTNGSTGNQTFGITSGTLGCTQDGMVTSRMKMALFIQDNKDQLARDMSVGKGESLAALSHLMGVQPQDQAAFNHLTKDNVARIFSTDNVATSQVISSLREVLASNSTLSHYQTAL